MDKRKTISEIVAIGLTLSTAMVWALYKQAKDNEKYKNVPMTDKKVTFTHKATFYEDQACEKTQQIVKPTPLQTSSYRYRFEEEYEVTSAVYSYDGVLYEISSVDEEEIAINNGAKLQAVQIINNGIAEYIPKEYILVTIYPKTKKLV